MQQCALQTHRFSWLFVVFLFTSSTCQEFHFHYSQFLTIRRLYREDSDFSLKSKEMCDFFYKRGYPVTVVQAGHHRAQQIDRQSALQTS